MCIRACYTGLVRRAWRCRRNFNVPSTHLRLPAEGPGGGGDIIMRIAAGPLAWCRLYQTTQKRVFACVALRALPFLIWRFLWSLLALEIKPFVHAGIDRAWSKLVNIDGNFPCAARKCASIPCASVARMRTFLLRRKTSYSVRAPAAPHPEI